MKRSTSLKFLLISLLLFNPVTAQLLPNEKTKFIHKFPGNNMLENSINCFLQDRQGFMWIGTKGGLFRYDGYNFKLFKMDPQNDNSLSDNFVRCLAEYSKDELILIGTTKGGLNIYDKNSGRFSRFLPDKNNPHSIGSDNIFDILEDEDGKIWLATIEGGLNLFNIEKKVFKKYLINDNNTSSKSKYFLKCLYLDKANGLWVGTRFSGLYLFDRNSENFKRFSFKNDKKNRIFPNNLWSINKDQKNNLWIGAYEDGIVRLRMDKKHNYKIEKMSKANGLGNFPIIKIYCDRQGIIWVGTWTGGLLKYDNKTNRFIQYTNDEENPHSISSNHVLTIFEDNSGTLWVGTHGGGINIIQPKKWKFNPNKFNRIKKNTAHVDQVRSILFQDQMNILWLGTSTGLIKVNSKKREKIKYRHIPGDNKSIAHIAINAMCQGRDVNSLWIGTPAGLSFMNTKTDEFLNYEYKTYDPLSSDIFNILCLTRDKTNILWIGTNNKGLFRFDPVTQKFMRYKIYLKNSLSLESSSINTIFEGRNGALYLGTANGVKVFDRLADTLSSFPSKSRFNPFAKTNVSQIFRDTRDIFWIGSLDYGLFKYDGQTGKYNLFTEKDGLPSNNICGILEDRNGFLYLSTDNGISFFDPIREEFINYGTENGLHDNEFNVNSYYQSNSGKMYFGGINGYSSFNPDKIVKNNFIPPVYITKFNLLYDQNNPVKNILYASSIQLNYKMNSFSVEFVALNFINSLENQYLYKLEGYDQDWQEADEQREVVYKNVEPGNYTFRVIASNNDGIWNEQGDTLEIYIKPPFWKTWSFKIIISCLLIGMIYLVIKRRFVQLKKESENRQRFTHSLITNQESERKRIAAELHDSLGQDLLVIKNRTNLILKKESGENINQLEQICSIADEAINNIRQISHNLHPYQLAKIGLTDALKSMVEKINKASNIKFEYDIDDIDNLLPKEREINCYRILQELMNNILKHSKAIKAWVKINRAKQSIVINVKDNGIGFDYEKARKEYRGFGLSGVRERIEILKGKLEIKSVINDGASFFIEIPIP